MRKLRWKNGQAFGLGLRIRWNRLRKCERRNQRCDICGKRMPLDGTGIGESIGSLHLRYHVKCYQASMREVYGKQPKGARA